MATRSTPPKKTLGIKNGHRRTTMRVCTPLGVKAWKGGEADNLFFALAAGPLARNTIRNTMAILKRINSILKYIL